MSRSLRWYDAITANIYFFALTTLSQTLTPLVVPLLVQKFVGEGQQGAFYGSMRLWSLMMALLVQSLMGTLSDRSRLPWGRRRPFIFTGALANLVILAAIGFAAGLEGMAGYWILFLLLMLHMIAANTAQGAVQGLIPDLVPESQRGRFSGVKAILEVPLPVILVSFVIGRAIAAGNLWGGLLTAMSVVLVCMLLTMLVPEKRPEAESQPLDWRPFLRLALMTALFSAVILALGQTIRWLPGALAGNESRNTLLLMFGIAGFIAMLLATGLGVWLSVRLSVGAEIRRRPAFTWWVVNRLAFLIGSTNLASFAIYFLQGRLGLEREQAAGPASQLLMFVGIFILFTALPGGWLADRLGHKLLVAVSGLIAALGVLVLILSRGLAPIYVGGVLIGVAAGFFYTANWALGTDLAPREEAGRYLGISNLAGAGAGAIGAYIGGPIADFFTVHFPETPGLGYVLLFAIYGLMFLFSIVALYGIRPGDQPGAVSQPLAASTPPVAP